MSAKGSGANPAPASDQPAPPRGDDELPLVDSRQHYEIVDEVARGGWGRIFRAYTVNLYDHLWRISPPAPAHATLAEITSAALDRDRLASPARSPRRRRG